MSERVLDKSTVTLIGNFYDFDGQLTDPSLPVLKIYDKWKNLYETISLSGANNVGVGVYEYYYTVNSDNLSDSFYYEFYGEINTYPILSRKRLEIEFS